MNPRFCIKNGMVDWSASPNVDTFDVVDGARPFDGKVLTQGALRQVVHLHYMHKISGGAKGRLADLGGATLNHDARQLIAAKLGEKGAALWAEVVATMGI